ncbi:MAG: CDP-glycerol glycerophosphotransferase family protein [Bacteroidales bacterium]|nr:CDP-glycerol glycerophosphotransferase family protein [Bacteroidales bacterium]
MRKKSYDKSLSYRLKLIWAYKDVLRNHVPAVSRRYFESFRKHQLAAARRLWPKYEAAADGGAPVEVAFILTISGMWKVDYLFKALQDDKHYHPYVVICPYSIYKGFSDEEVEATLERTRAFVAGKGYEYVIPRDTRGRWQDIKKTLRPDIVFFTTPYKDIPPQYFVYNFRDTLTCYVSYGFSSLNTVKINFDLIFHNLVGVYFLETELNRRTAHEVARNKGVNVAVSGYPGTEVFLRKDYHPADPWKPQPHKKKRVIWAPHHTIDKTLELSTFLLRCDDMLALAERYKDEIQFAFKPHQLLKFKLQQEWGAERVEAYYSRWRDMENTQLEEANYVDLFLTSDAMIHDCGSFTTEYLFMNKPVMYLTHDEHYKERFSPFGLEAFECHYRGSSVNAIESFLRDAVIGGEDPKHAAREEFFDKYLKPIDGKLPSEMICSILEQLMQGKTNNL